MDLDNVLTPTENLTGKLDIYGGIPTGVKDWYTITNKSGALITYTTDSVRRINTAVIDITTEAAGLNIYHFGKNFFINTISSGSSNGVTWTVNADGSISLTGTASGTVFIQFYQNIYLPEATYTMKKSGNSGIQMCLRVGDYSGNNRFSSTTADQTGPVTAGIYSFIVRIASGTVTAGITIYPQLEIANESTAYEKYAGNIYPVTWSDIGSITGSYDVISGKLTVSNDTYQINSVNLTSLNGINNIYCNVGTFDNLTYFETVGHKLGGT